MGLVDYPSFNNTNPDHSDTDNSDSSSSKQQQNFSIINGGGANCDKDKKIKHGSTKEQTKYLRKSYLKSSKKRKALIATFDKVDDYTGVPWPSPNEQMVIDKIAGYVVKNGTSFEQAIVARGELLFFLIKLEVSYCFFLC